MTAPTYISTPFCGATADTIALRISDAKLEKLADLSKIKGFPIQFGPGTWTGLGPGDGVLLSRDISTQEIYAFDLQLP